MIWLLKFTRDRIGSCRSNCCTDGFTLGGLVPEGVWDSIMAPNAYNTCHDDHCFGKLHTISKQ